MTETPKFEIDPKEFTFPFEICWICKNRKNCPMEHECETIADMDNDNPNGGVDKA